MSDQDEYSKPNQTVINCLTVIGLFFLCLAVYAGFAVAHKTWMAGFIIATVVCFILAFMEHDRKRP